MLAPHYGIITDGRRRLSRGWPASTPPRARFRPIVRRVLVAVAVAGLLTSPLDAARTGLNNVPTADTLPDDTGVVQFYSGFGVGRKPVFLSGIGLGLGPALGNFEAGVDTQWETGHTLPAFFNAKWAAELEKGLPSLGIGISNLAARKEDRDVFGQVQTYAVLSYDADFARFHAGYTFQHRNDAMFFGFDQWWVLANQKVTFRADITEIDKRNQWLASAGFSCKLADGLVFDLWQSVPTKHGRSYTTARLTIGFRY